MRLALLFCSLFLILFACTAAAQPAPANLPAAAVQPAAGNEFQRGEVPAELRAAASSAQAFTIAHEGQSYLFNAEAGVARAPFVRNVFRPFGFSADSRYFLYLQAKGRFPTSRLVLLDMLQGDIITVAESGAFYAEWAPGGSTLAYLTLESPTLAKLSLFDVRTFTAATVATGLLDGGSIDWSSDGRHLRFRAKSPATADPFHDQKFSETTGVYSLDMKRTLSSEELEQASLNFSGEFYNALEDGRAVVKRVDSLTKTEQTVEPGDIYARTAGGVVVRNFVKGGVEYRFLSSQGSGTAQNLAFSSNWLLPFAGSAYMVQGGAGYTATSCDGRPCMVIGHTNTLNFALDWQQTPEDGQGDRRVLAVEDGTVVSVVNNVTCSSNSSCVSAIDSFAANCTANGGAGNSVVIAHPDGSYSMYGHMQSGSVAVVAGQAVTQGTFLGIQGHAGAAKSPTKYRVCGDHLHFQRQMTPVIFAQSITTNFAELPCGPTCMTAYVSQNSERTSTAAATLTLSLAPPTVTSGLPVTTLGNRVVLPAAAGAGGAVVALASSDPSAALPASVTVPAGSVSATFPVTTTAVSTPTPVTVTANDGATNASAPLIVTPPALSWYWNTVTAVGGGATISGNELTLTGAAPAGGAAVALTSSNVALAQVPASVSIAQGGTLGTFAITTSNVTSSAPVTITASYGGVSRSRSFTLNPLALSTLTFPRTSVLGGLSTTTNTVSLNAPTASDVSITLTSSNPAVAFGPATVLIPAGSQTSAQFTIQTTSVVSSTPVTFTASYNGVNVTRVLTVTGPALSSFLLSPNSVTGGNATASNRVGLNTAAPAGGALVVFTSANTAIVPTPAPVLIPAGSTTATFTINTQSAAQAAGVAITASYGGVTYTQSLTVLAPGLTGLSITPAQTIGGLTATGTLQLDGPAPGGGYTVALASSNSIAAPVPATVVVPAGERTATFPITTGIPAAAATATVTATFGTVSRTATLAVTPMNIVSVNLAQTSVRGGTVITGNTVTVSTPAPAGGITLQLASSDPTAATVQATVTVQAGATVSDQFSIPTLSIGSVKTTAITATYAISSASANLTVTAPVLTAFTLTPNSVTGGGTSTGTVTLGVSPLTDAVVTLTSSDPVPAPVPPSVTVLAGSTTASFTITTPAVSAPVSATIQAALGTVTLSATLGVNPIAVTAVTLGPIQIPGGLTTTQNYVDIASAAPAGGVVITLSSSNPAAAQVPATVTIAAGATRSPLFSIVTSSVASQAVVTIGATSGGSGAQATLTVTPTALASLAISPALVIGGQAGTGNVLTLDSPAPAGGAAVTLTASDPAAMPPAAVLIPAGATSSSPFSIPTNNVTTPVAVTISASYGDVTRTGTLTVSPILLTSIALAAPSVTAGGTVTGNTVSLNAAAPAGGILVSLASTNPVAGVPASVLIPAGASSASFDIVSTPSAAAVPVTVSASYNGTTVNAPFTVNGLSLSSLTLASASVIGGTAVSPNTVTLSNPAPNTGAVVSLTSSNPAAAAVPATVAVAPGATSVTFASTTSLVGSVSPVTITAAFAGVTRTVTLTVNPITVASMAVSPVSFGGGRTTTANNVTISSAAPAGGAAVTLTSSNPAVASVPAAVTVAAGATVSPNYSIATTAVSVPTNVTITATLGGSTMTRTITANPPSLTSLTLSPASVVGGLSSNANKVYLDVAAPAGGALVTLSSSDTTLAVTPASVLVAAGATLGPQFTITTSPVSVTRTVTITAVYGGQTRTATLTLTPAAFSSVGLGASTVKGGNPVNANAWFTGPVAAATAVTLSSSNPAVAAVPASVTVAAGSSGGPFVVTTSPVAAPVVVTITGTANGVTRTVNLTVN